MEEIGSKDIFLKSQVKMLEKHLFNKIVEINTVRN